MLTVWVKCRGSSPLFYSMCFFICQSSKTILVHLDDFPFHPFMFPAHTTNHTWMPHAHINTLFCAPAHSSRSHTHYSTLITYPKELQRCHDDLKRARADLDKQKGELQRKSEALRALERLSGNREAELLSDIDKLTEQSQKQKAELEKAKEVKHHLDSMEKKWL